MATVFSKIIQKEIPAEIIAENDQFIAFLDIMPLVHGHTLIVPKQEIDYIFDIENNQLSAMIVFAKSVAAAIRKSIPCKRIGMSVIGLEVPHAHIHLVPMHSADDLNFTRPKLKPTPAELADVAAKIRAAF